MNVLVIEGRPLIAIGLRLWIYNCIKGSEVICLENEEDVEKTLSSKSFDLVILDELVPKSGTNNLIKSITINDAIKVIVFSTDIYFDLGLQYIKSGASGFLNKKATKKEFELAVETVLRNTIYIPKNLLEKHFLKKNKKKKKRKKGLFTVLSIRQNEILKHVIEGKTNKEISIELALKPSTISTHKRRIFVKLKVSNVVELFALVKKEFPQL